MLTSLDRAPCGFVSLSDDGTMLDLNATLAEILGYTKIELAGWHLQKILPPGARIFYQTHVFPLLKMHGRVEEIYIALRTKDGRDVPMLMNAIRADAAIECVFVKMIQRHAFEDQLLQARRSAEEANAAKAAFLSMMSHDLRTPLTSITGYAMLLTRGVLGPLEGEQRDAILRISESADALLHLINDILAFAKLESGKIAVRPAQVNVVDAVARAERLLRPRLDQDGLVLESRCGDDVVIADPERLQQILLNLLTNASKFTPRDGRIEVTSDGDAGRVRIHVRDTGIGIAPEQLDRIFEPFVQLESGQSHRGVGLGLAISRDLVRAMDGELSVASVVGEGSTFTIELPRG